MRPDPVELRGVGIQITKLDNDQPAQREVGQGTLQFGMKRKREAESLEPQRQPKLERLDSPLEQVKKDDEEEDHVVDPTDEERAKTPASDQSLDRYEDRSPTPTHIPVPTRPSPPLTRRRSSLLDAQHAAPEAGPSRKPIAISSDGLDPDFLAALPPELQQEVKRDYGRSRQSAPLVPVEAAPVPAAELPKVQTPPKNKGKSSFAHITKQLRPKTKTQLKAKDIAGLPLYGAWQKAQDVDEASDIVSVVSDEGSIDAYRISELRELGIDPDVFAELPEELRREIVAEERRKRQQRKVLHRPADTSRLRARARNEGGQDRTASLSPSKTSRGGSLPPVVRPLASVSLPVKPALLKATKLSDVLGTITRWIESRDGAAPAAKDAGKVKSYLVKCMDPKAGAGGIEMVAEALSWMRLLLSERWRAPYGREVREMEDAGAEWWRTWREFKDEVDGISIMRFGAPIRL